MGIPTARFSLLTGGGKIPDHDNEDGHSGGNHDHVDEHDSHGGLSCSLGDLLLNSPRGTESQKPRQRVSNADRKVFANPESFSTNSSLAEEFPDTSQYKISR